jgi:LCP family protein required for cell wall assembly
MAGAATNAYLAQLQGNIIAVDISDQLDLSTDPAVAGTADDVSAADPHPIAQVDAGTGAYDPLDVVLMGSDTRAGKGNGGFGSVEKFGTTQRSDTVIVLHIAADRKSAVAVSIPRDTMITLPVCKRDGEKVVGYTARFNVAIELGGPGCTIKAINQMSGLHIKNFMLVDFGGFKRIVEAVGGVEICLAAPVDDPLSGLKLDKGKHVVTGEEALAFVRIRHGIADGSDTSRIRRQQAFISSLLRKVVSSGTLLNPAALIGVLNSATESLTADPQLADINNLRDLALSLRDLKPAGVTFTTLPWTPNGDNATVSVNSSQAQPIWDALKNDTPWPPKGSAGADQPLLKTPPSEIHINVLNATGIVGKGKDVAKELRKQGYVVESVGNAASPVTATAVEYDPDWEQSAKTLGYAAQTTSLQKAKGQGQTMNLIVGSDYTSIRPVEISEITQDNTANVNSGDENYCAA